MTASDKYRVLKRSADPTTQRELPGCVAGWLCDVDQNNVVPAGIKVSTWWSLDLVEEKTSHVDIAVTLSSPATLAEAFRQLEAIFTKLPGAYNREYYDVESVEWSDSEPDTLVFLWGT